MSEPASAIRFLLDGVVHTVSDVEPTTTLLEYLREDLNRTGTKEGCAEGDCGACTVVEAELVDEAVRYRAFNSCIQFLPTLDGKALVTVESLKQGPEHPPHPIQRAMTDCHGSQCGFCTPGFVMSLFSLYKSNPAPSRQQVNHALAGNLCRCTGYRPIIEAAARMYEYAVALPDAERSWLTATCREDQDGGACPDEAGLIAELQRIRPVSSVELHGRKCRYFAPRTTADLTERLREVPQATILAGGTDVGLWVTKQHRELPEVVYIGNVPELNGCRVDGDYLEIGATVSLTDAFEVLQQHYPDLSEIARRFGSPPICNLGTLCGNIANGSPVGDSMPALIVLGARLRLCSNERERELPLDEFYSEHRRTALQPGEFVRAVKVPQPQPGWQFRSYKISKRFDQDISGLCAAYWLQLEDARITDVRICYGGLAAIPKRAYRTEEVLRHSEWNEAAVDRAAQALHDDYSPITDLRASHTYRRRVAANLLKRFYHESRGATNTSVWQYAG